MTNNIVTGVTTGNTINWDAVGYDYIDLAYENAHKEAVKDALAKLEEEGYSEEDIQEEAEGMAEEEMEGFDSSGGTQLYGTWTKDAEGYYIPDTNGEFAFIYDSNDNYVQVVWSKTTKECRKCSPCFPMQGDLDSEGNDYTAYCLPDYAINE